MDEIGTYSNRPPAQQTLPGLSPAGEHKASRLSPKRPSIERAGLADAFPYYAGFSFEWACSLLNSQELPADAVVLDPWNGSGTTTLAAQYDGYRSIGIDRNPVANVVASLRTNTMARDAPTVAASEVYDKPVIDDDDPLTAWFDRDSAARIRAWTIRVGPQAEKHSPLATVALFRAVRQLTKVFEGSNPTWVKRANSSDERIAVPSQVVDSLVETEQEFLRGRITAMPAQDLAPVQILTANSSSLPLRDETVDLVLTSPPYLTRIDYAVAYTRELALLGIDITREREFRASLMGTTLIRPVDDRDLSVGAVAADLLESVENHSSKASAGYYSKQARQYLRDLTVGLDEISRVTKPGASLHLVVQDSYYKDVPVRLADICIDEANLRGWVPVDVIQHPVRRSLTSLNISAQKYKKSDVSETVISLQKSIRRSAHGASEGEVDGHHTT